MVLFALKIHVLSHYPYFGCYWELQKQQSLLFFTEEFASFFSRAESLGHSSSLMYPFISPSKLNVLFQHSRFTFYFFGRDDEIHVLCQSQ